MDFRGLKCPICNTNLEADDDIVVCPECGAPHHRECYEELGHCYYEQKHKDNFDYAEYIKEKKAKIAGEAAPGFETIACPKCKAENPRSAFYCNSCGQPLNNVRPNATANGQQGSMPNGNIPPQPNSPFGTVMFDPMAGIDPQSEIDDGVTAGEVAKYVQSNTPYFLRIFANIRDNNKSKFNFSAFLFSGGYMIFRKMYKAGIFFTTIIGLLLIGSLLVQTLPVFGWQEIFYDATASLVNEGMMGFYMKLPEAISKLPSQQQLIFYLPYILELIRWIFMFIAGSIANRAYFKDSIRKIKKIKDNSNGDEKVKNDKLQSAGGVNTVAAIVMFICLIIINSMPYFFVT